MKKLNHNDINPGVRKIVRELRKEKFNTCDSGDGETHQYECDRSHPKGKAVTKFKIGDLVEVTTSDASSFYKNKILAIYNINSVFCYTDSGGWYPSSLKLLSRACVECGDHKCPASENHPRYWELMKLKNKRKKND